MTIKLLNIDCMEYMKGLEDNAFDLAIVDPPYGLGEAGQRIMSRGSDGKNQKFWGTKNTKGTDIPSTYFPPKEWDNEAPDRDYFIELQRVSKNQIIFGANHFISKIPNNDSSCWIIWDKDNGTSNFADCEMAWGSFSTAVRKFKFRWSGMLQGDMKNKEIRIHPTQKPAKLYEWLLINYAKKGQRILDTHLGSGSSAIAAYYFGCHFVGCELDTEYYDSASARIDHETKQHALILE